MPAAPWQDGWHAGSVEQWERLWSTPQATQWREDDPELDRWILLHEVVWFRSKTPSIGMLTEMRQIEDRHGLNPKAMAAMVWRIGEPEAPQQRPKPARRRTLKAV